MRIIHLVTVIFLVVIMMACSDFSRVQKRGTLEEKIQAALKYYEAEDYYKSGVLLEEVIPMTRGRKEGETALFYLAYTHFHQREFIMSTYYFKEFYRTYPRSNYTEEAVFMHAKSLFSSSPESNLDQTNSQGAMYGLQEYANRYPEGKYIDDVNKMFDIVTDKLLKKEYENTKLYHKIHLHKSSVAAISSFIERNPNSGYNEELSFLRIESQFFLAQNSVIKKQQDRFKETIQFYLLFIDRYPNSNYKKRAEHYYTASLNKSKK